jgi:hypothetical protein
MARAPQEKVGFRERMKQLGMVFQFTAKRDKLFVPLALLAGLVPLLVFIVLGVLLGWIWIPFGVLLGLLGVMIVLNLRANKAMMSEAEGTPGAAASIVENMRGDWRVYPAIASTTQFDMVHLVLSRCGIVLLGEGHPGRVRGLIGQEKRRLAKVIGSTDMRDFIIGNGDGEIPVSKVRVTLMKLPRTVTGKDVNSLDKRLKALTARPQMPKGAVPKNMRPPKMGKIPRAR